MKIVVDVPDPLISRIKRAVDEGGYESARDFVTTAMENQLELEESGEEQFKTLNEAISEAPSVEEDSPDAGEEHDDLVHTDGLGQREYDSVPTVSPPSDEQLASGPLWGQYNRVFPVKLVVRRLANIVQKQNTDETSTPRDTLEWIEFDRFAEETAQLARNFGLQVKEHDREASRGRGEKLSAGLPTGEDAEKSIERFKTHFVGSSKRGGRLGGAAPHLLFVDITEEDVGRIGITETGLEFAQLYNPLLDNSPDADTALSTDERTFYVDHVQNELEDEFDAMLEIVGAIEDGVNRPDGLTDRVSEMNDDWSDSQASTIRSGLVSRMHELGLMHRERVGQRGVAYKLTSEGKDFLENRGMNREV
jgi:Arc/MetJ-type ribon-helix-helix transcriptional regulator